MEILTMMIFMSILFMKSKHPLTMGMILIAQSLMISLAVGYMKSFLFSYILMMIMLSGVLVLFMYMSSVASNEKFQYTIKNKVIILFFITLSMIENIKILGQLKIYTENTNYNEISYMMMSLLSNNTPQLIIMLVMYMFYAMVVISFIVSIHEGPMRPKS